MQRTLKNRTIFCRDNIDILRGIDSQTIDLIYLDPPFNKKKIFTAPIGTSAQGAGFQDIFRQEDLKDEWVGMIAEQSPALYEYLRGIKGFGHISNFAYLAYMAIRLIECHRILKETGSLYLHCDPTMSHYLKILLDCVFGEKHFRNEIVWCYKSGGASKRCFARKHDIILFYAKTKYQYYMQTKEKSYMGVNYSTGNINVILHEDEHIERLGPHTLVNMKDWWEIGMIATSNK